ncbi:hypothetical protein ACLOJK_002428 [Asimina triloba]
MRSKWCGYFRIHTVDVANILISRTKVWTDLKSREIGKRKKKIEGSRILYTNGLDLVDTQHVAIIVTRTNIMVEMETIGGTSSLGELTEAVRKSSRFDHGHGVGQRVCDTARTIDAEDCAAAKCQRQQSTRMEELAVKPPHKKAHEPLFILINLTIHPQPQKHPRKLQQPYSTPQKELRSSH